MKTRRETRENSLELTCIEQYTRCESTIDALEYRIH